MRKKLKVYGKRNYVEKFKDKFQNYFKNAAYKECIILYKCAVKNVNNTVIFRHILKSKYYFTGLNQLFHLIY